MRLVRRYLAVGFGLLVMGTGAVFFNASHAGAVSKIAPDITSVPREFDDDVWLETAINGGTNTLYAPKSVVTVYTKSTNPVITIIHPNHCTSASTNSAIDSATTATSVVYHFAGATNKTYPTGSVSGRALVDPAGCADINWTTTMNLAGKSKSTKNGLGDYYEVQVIAQASTAVTGGVNAFRVQTNSGFVSMTTDSGYQFAVQQRPSLASNMSDFNITFAVPCDEASSGVRKALHWFDDDAGTLQNMQSANPMYFELLQRDRGSNDPWQSITTYNGPWAGNQAPNAEPFGEIYTFLPSKEYNWRWRNIVGSNGIQFEVPFDSIYTQVSCAAPPWTVTGDSRVSPSTVATDGDANFKHTVSRSSGTGTPSGVNWRIYGGYITGNSKPTSAGSWAAARGSGGTLNGTLNGTTTGEIKNTASNLEKSKGNFYCQFIRYNPDKSSGGDVKDSTPVCVTLQAQWKLKGSSTINNGTGTIELKRGASYNFEHFIENSGADIARDVTSVVFIDRNGTDTERNRVSGSSFAKGTTRLPSRSGNVPYTGNGSAVGYTYCEWTGYSPIDSPEGNTRGRGNHVCYKVVEAPMEGTAEGYCDYIKGRLTNPNYNTLPKSGRGSVVVHVLTGDNDERFNLGNISGNDFNFDLTDLTTGIPADLRNAMSDGDAHTVEIYFLPYSGDDGKNVLARTFTIPANRCVNYKLAPQVSASANSIEEDGTVQFTFTVTKDRLIDSKRTNWCAYGRNIPVAQSPGAAMDDQTGNPTQRGSQIIPTSDSCGSRIFTGSANSSTVVFTESVPWDKFTAGQKVCRTLSISPSNGFTNTNTYAWSEEKCVVIGKSPYVQTLGGDTRAGRAFPAADSICRFDTSSATGDPNKGAIWASSSAIEERGSGSEYATFASGTIREFGSKSKPGTGSVSLVANWMLTFANTGNTRGSFNPISGSTADCMRDYVKEFKDKVTTASVPATDLNIIDHVATDGTTTVKKYVPRTPGGVVKIITPLNAKIPAKAKLVYVIEGNVQIDRNIEYVDSYASKEDVPSIAIMATGTITIAKDVTRLDGFYATQKALITCDTPVANLKISECNKQLVFNGAVVAKKVSLLRTFGAQTTNGNADIKKEPAEKFNYTPELIFNSVLRSDNKASIYSLYQKDLPARY